VLLLRVLWPSPTKARNVGTLSLSKTQRARLLKTRRARARSVGRNAGIERKFCGTQPANSYENF
jgi:hypothetical protein